MSASQNVIEVANLVCAYGRGRNRMVAVRDLSFNVRAGECVGFIGPNGAGKSTTIKTLMGFMYPEGGKVDIFDAGAGSMASRQRIGYLPEVSLYYPFMKARELLELYGGLQGMTRAALKERIPALLEMVGLEGLGEKLLKAFSKGMQQRLGIAQAIIADPDLLILDELSSGLDPIGRYDLRKVLLRLKREGKTIFFSSHELTEVEALCDRVVMIYKGEKIADERVEDLVAPLNQYEIIFAAPNADTAQGWIGDRPLERRGDRFALVAQGIDEFSAVVQRLTEHQVRILSTRAINTSLEGYFMNLIRPAVAESN